jgi:hypothetical protein
MGRRERYRRSPMEPDDAKKRPAWMLFPVGIILTLALVTVIAGPQTPDVLAALCNASWALLVLLPAMLLGLAVIRPLRQTPFIAASPWPDGWRLVVAAAIGLGLLGLLTLGLGSLHLLGGWIPVLLLLACAAAGYPAARELAANFNGQIWRRGLQKRHLLLLLACAPVACMLVAATIPAGTLWHTEGNGYDVQEYHLQLPKQFLEINSTAPVAGNIYSYFPLNMEMLYVLIGALARLGGASGVSFIYSLVFGAQILHMLITLLAGAAVALAPLHMRIPARILALLVVLCTPWTIVIGTLAYNDGAVLLYTVLALSGAVRCSTRGEALLLGVLLGLALGCKMTAGVMVALPVAAMLTARRRWGHLAAAAAVALVIYSPWALRSMTATHTPNSMGNPIFPLFAQTLGMDDWDVNLAMRFDTGHKPPANLTRPAARIGQLADQSLLDRQFSPGLAAFIDAPKYPAVYPTDTTPWPMRFGILWLALLPALVLAIFRGTEAWLLLLCLGIQVLAWLTYTQLQARFLLPAIVPLAWLLAIGTDVAEPLRVWARFLLACQAAFCALLLRPEAGLFLGPVDADHAPLIGRVLNLPEDWFLNGPAAASVFSPADTFYLEGTSTPLYFQGHVIYSTVFDRNLLAQVLDEKGPAAALAWLQKQGVNYLIVDWNEIDRLRRTYGFDAAITPPAILAMEVYGLAPLKYQTPAGIEIYQVPQTTP